MQDEEYERALQMDIEREAREEREAEMARRAEMAARQVEHQAEKEEEEDDEDEETPTCLTLEELRARRLLFFQPTSTDLTARCGATTKAGTPCKRRPALGCHGRCKAHRAQK